MEKDKRVIAVENSRSLARVGAQIGLVGKILEEERKEYWKSKLRGLQDNRLFEVLLFESQQCILEFPNWFFGYLGKGIAKEEKENYLEALKNYDKAIELNPNYANNYSNRGSTKHSLRDFEGAIKDYNKALELNANNFETNHNILQAKDGFCDLRYISRF